MREILFRGKRIDNGEWIEGNFGKYALGNGEKISCISIPKANSVAGSLCYDVEPETVGQFTEKTDINRLKVFEGHIIKAKHHYIGDANEFLSRKIRHAYGKEVFDCDILEELTYWRNYVVEYSKKKGAYIGRNGSDQHELKTLLNFCHCGEIIGNIRDNPELLGGDIK